MANGNTIELEGEIAETLPNAMYRVKLDNGRLALATIAGRLRISSSRIFPGDRVKMEFTPYDQDRGRIIFKYRK